MRATMARVSTSSQSSLPTTELASYSAAMTTTTYRGLPGFALNDTPAASSPPDPTQSLRENLELVDDLTRFAEGIYSESAVRKKWRLSEETWELLGNDDELVRAIEKTRIQRVRNGSFKRERSQQHVTRAPDVLAGIMDDPKQSAKHRIDSAKVLDSFSGNGPQAEAEPERFVIKIDLGADLRAKGQDPNPGDVITIEATPRPSTPKQIEDDHNEQPSDKWRR